MEGVLSRECDAFFRNLAETLNDNCDNPTNHVVGGGWKSSYFHVNIDKDDARSFCYSSKGCSYQCGFLCYQCFEIIESKQDDFRRLLDKCSVSDKYLDRLGNVEATLNDLSSKIDTLDEIIRTLTETISTLVKT